jgi:SAM-dependent methyltransferase
MKPERCTICGNTRLETVDSHAARCAQCDLLINLETEPVDYSELGNATDPGKQHWRRINSQRRLAIVEPHLRDHRALVDIGCGSGQMLEAAAQRLPLRFGFDANPTLIRDIRQSADLRVECGHFSAERLPGDIRNAAKVFTLSHVIEHVAEPNALVAQVAAAMLPGDLLYIEVPLHTGQAFRTQGYAWSLWYHEHLCLYSPTALAALAARSGLATAAAGTRIFARGSHSNKTRLRLLRQNPLAFLRALLTKPSYLSIADVLIADYGFLVLRKN